MSKNTRGNLVAVLLIIAISLCVWAFTATEQKGFIQLAFLLFILLVILPPHIKHGYRNGQE